MMKKHETLIYSAVGLAALFVLTSLTGIPLFPFALGLEPQTFPFLGDSFTFCVVLVIGGLAIALAAGFQCQERPVAGRGPRPG